MHLLSSLDNNSVISHDLCGTATAVAVVGTGSALAVPATATGSASGSASQWQNKKLSCGFNYLECHTLS